MIPQWLIEKKRDGIALTAAEIQAFVQGFTNGEIPDYQMAALAMAIFFRGMNNDETAALTDAMMRSGDQIAFENWPLPTADKHSTGGIGDKITLALAPLAASIGVAAPMIAGRGLGLTGGTLDKLDAIPGFNSKLSVEKFKEYTQKIGCCLIGQTERIAPADRKLYALRDVTGTVASIPLITASIMSKKLAIKVDGLVFDVKCGTGAFMRTLEQARQLAHSLMRVGRSMNRRMVALITDMNQPLGASVGNSVEVYETIEVLKGRGPSDVRKLTIELTAWMAFLSGAFTSLDDARSKLTDNLANGAALEKFRQMIAVQGGNPRVADDPEAILPRPGMRADVLAPRDGWIRQVDAEAIGRVALQLGAGRKTVEDKIDLAAGIDRLLGAGTKVARGQPLMRLCGRDRAIVASQFEAATAAVIIEDAPPSERQLILETVT